MINSALVIDTDTNCTPHLDVLKARGVRKIGRYFSSSGWKRLTKTEAQAICGAGFELFTVFENSGSPALSIDSGRHDAQIAMSQARAIGQPEGSAIYFAMENLPHGYRPDDIEGLKLYFEGVRRTFKGAYKVGAYSNGTTLDALLAAQLCDYCWLSASLSFAGSRDFAASHRWDLKQGAIDLNWAGVSVDVNDAKEEFGAFTLPGGDAVSLPAEPNAANTGAEHPEGDLLSSPKARIDKLDHSEAHAQLKAQSVKYTIKSWLVRVLGFGGGSTFGLLKLNDLGISDPVGSIGAVAGFFKTYGLELTAGAFLALLGIILTLMYLQREDLIRGDYRPSGEPK